jgi:hypothetical protein
MSKLPTFAVATLPTLSSLLLAGSMLVSAGTAANADLIGIQNNSAPGNGPIVTVNLTTQTFVNSFIPDQAKIDSNNGRGVAVIGNFLYYTELTNNFGPSTGIFVAPFNNGAGGTDITSFPNPVPNTGIVDLAAANGKLYVMTGYPSGPEVIQATDGNGHNIGSLITLTTLSSANLTNSDGFTVLPNGNFLINNGDLINSYNQYNPLTGAEIANTTIQAIGSGGVPCGDSTGVDNIGTNLVFDCVTSLVVDDFNGHFISSTSTGTLTGEDIALVQVPEPTSFALLSTGLLGLVMLRRRKLGRATSPHALA